VSTAKQLLVPPRLLYPDDGGSTPLRNFCNYLPSTRRNIPKHLQRHNIAVKTSDFAELIKPNILFWSECYCDLRNESGWLELANDALCSHVFQYVEFYRTAILRHLICFIFQSVIQTNIISVTTLPLLYPHNWGLGPTYVPFHSLWTCFTHIKKLQIKNPNPYGGCRKWLLKLKSVTSIILTLTF